MCVRSVTIAVRLFFVVAVLADDIYLLKDIKSGYGDSNARRFTSIGPYVYFLADDGTQPHNWAIKTPLNLWRTDGTEAGTIKLTTVNVADDSLVDLNGVAYFIADYVSGNEYHSRELWRSNGTVSGTTLVKNFGQTGHGAHDLTVSGNHIYFTAGFNNVLWRSDGTEVGTVPVPGAGPMSFLSTQTLDGFLFGRGYSSGAGEELWKCDGSTYEMVKDIFAGTSSSQGLFHRGVVSGNNFYFVAKSAISHGYQLWKTDGTDAGTIQITTDSRLTIDNSMGPQNLTPNGNGGLFFVMDDGIHGQELWKTDGTPAGTHMVSDIKPGGGRYDGTLSGVVGNPVDIPLATANGRVLFSADDGQFGLELWTSNGTLSQVIADVNPGPGSSNPAFITMVIADPPIFYFAATDDGQAYSLWKTDGVSNFERVTLQRFCGLHSIRAPSANMALLPDGSVVFAQSDYTVGWEVYRAVPKSTFDGFTAPVTTGVVLTSSSTSSQTSTSGQTSTDTNSINTGNPNTVVDQDPEASAVPILISWMLAAFLAGVLL